MYSIWYVQVWELKRYFYPSAGGLKKMKKKWSLISYHEHRHMPGTTYLVPCAGTMYSTRYVWIVRMYVEQDQVFKTRPIDNHVGTWAPTTWAPGSDVGSSLMIGVGLRESAGVVTRNRKNLRSKHQCDSAVICSTSGLDSSTRINGMYAVPVFRPMYRQ